MSGQWRLGDSVLRRGVDIGSSAFLCGSDIGFFGSSVLRFGSAVGHLALRCGFTVVPFVPRCGSAVLPFVLRCENDTGLQFFGAGLLLDIWLFGARMMPGFGFPVRGCCSAFGSSARA